MRSINPVLVALAQARTRTAPLFARWCELNGASFCPARPADIARFVFDCASLGIQRLWPALQDVSKHHVSLGLADPTLGSPVANAVSTIAGVDPPRSWADADKQRFRLLPYDMQLLVVSCDIRREKALRRAQNEAAAARQKLVAAQQMQPKASEENDARQGEQHSNS